MDIVVIGSGCFGSWIAYSLAERGHNVTLVDSHGPGNNRSSSGGETRIIRMSYGGDAIYTRMSHESLERWKRMFVECDENLFIESGALLTTHDDEARLEAAAATLARYNIRHQKLKSNELKKRFPQFAFDPGTTGLFEPDSGTLLSRRAVECVAKAAERIGVKRISMTAQPSTIKKKIPAERYIFACGAWLPTLFPKELGSTIFPTRQELFFFGVPNDSFASPHMPAWFDALSGFYSVPDVEHRGFKLGIDDHGPPANPETIDRVVTEKGIAKARAFVAKRFPALKDAPITESRVCVYENTWNGDFLIDELKPGIWIAGGGSGHGFKHGPAVGRYTADVIEGRIPPEPRFQLTSKRTKQSRRVY